MNKHHVEGGTKQAKGGVKDAVGKMTGDRRLQAEGKIEKAAGKVQTKLGNAKDRARRDSAR